jgi:phosphoribosyl 1,2-cyclic phosphate phosphodiesterase
MPYCFGENKYPGVPRIQLNEIDEKPFYIDNTFIEPIRVMHARLPIFGFRIKNIAYLTDVKTIEQTSIDKLKGLDILIINALRIDEHISHLSLSEALEISKKIDAKMTYFTHMSHDMGLHDDINKILPDNIQLAYDQLTIENDDDVVM